MGSSGSSLKIYAECDFVSIVPFHEQFYAGKQPMGRSLCWASYAVAAMPLALLGRICAPTLAMRPARSGRGVNGTADGSVTEVKDDTWNADVVDGLAAKNQPAQTPDSLNINCN